MQQAKRIIRKKIPDIEKVIGNTVTSQSCVAVSPSGDELAYCAGATIIRYCIKRNKQLNFLQNPIENKLFSCVTYSPDGKRIAAGESGFQPSVIVWDIVSNRVVSNTEKDNRHKHGIEFIEFSPDNKFLVTVGTEHDGTIRVWQNKGKIYELVCTKKNSRKVTIINII
jgi:WD40 repeat protein